MRDDYDRKIREPVVAKFSQKCQRFTEVCDVYAVLESLHNQESYIGRTVHSSVVQPEPLIKRPLANVLLSPHFCKCRRKWCARRATRSWARGRCETCAPESATIGMIRAELPDARRLSLSDSPIRPCPVLQVLCLQGRVLRVLRLRFVDAVLRECAHLFAAVHDRRLGSPVLLQDGLPRRKQR